MLSSTRLEETGSGSSHADWEENKGPHSALKIIVATVLERGLWPRPLLRGIHFDSVTVFVVLLFAVVFWRSGSGDLRHVGMLLFNRNYIKCKPRLNVWHSGFFYLINKIPFNVVLKIKKGGSVVKGT